MKLPQLLYQDFEDLEGLLLDSEDFEGLLLDSDDFEVFLVLYPLLIFSWLLIDFWFLLPIVGYLSIS